MNSDEMDQLEKRVLAIIRHEDTINPQVHRQDHEWVELQRKKELTRIARNEAITRHVLGWGIVGLITGLGTVIIHYFTKGNHG